MPRKQADTTPTVTGGGLYFVNPHGIETFSTGCQLLDLALAGGWAIGRIANIVGDKSTGKTLLAIEACANFARKYRDGKIKYNEVEAAFDKPYAEQQGLPLDRVEFAEPCFTVEDLFNDMEKFVDDMPKGVRGLYIVDSLDALSDKAELERKMGDASYGAEKAKRMSELFRRLNQRLSASLITVIIISQVRDKINAMFGRKTTRSGGRAMDFFATHVLYLAHMGTETRTFRGVTRATGINIKAKVDKNKIGLPFREVEFNIEFGFGIDDIAASISFLKETKQIARSGYADEGAMKQAMIAATDDELRQIVDKIQALTIQVWNEIETELVPVRKKYAD